MKIEQWSIDRIKPYEKNPRRNDKAVAAVKLGMEKVPVHPAGRCVNFTLAGPPTLDTLAIVSAR